MTSHNDTVIDDDEESCPLCIEPFDLSDKGFKPCPCGYQICQFCFNSLNTTYEKSTCPNCRRTYDKSKIEWKVPTAEEMKLDQQNKHKRAAAARRREAEKREVEASSRRNLAGIRVKQQNLVYVIGLEPNEHKDDATLIETLRGQDYFGQYGPIEKIIVSKPKLGAVNQGIGVYVTFKNKEDAAKCIKSVDGSPNMNGVLRAQYGTTKYCSVYLRGETCQNKNCSFLHENGEEGQTTTLQNEPIESKVKTVPARPPQTSQISYHTIKPAVAEPVNKAHENGDTSALPANVAWANAGFVKARRTSQAGSAPSPQLSQASVTHPRQEPPKIADPPSVPTKSTAEAEVSRSKAPTPAPTPPPPKPVDPIQAIFDDLKKSISRDLAFHFDDSSLDEEMRTIIRDMPPLFDRYGGAKRRLMQDRDAADRSRLEAEERSHLEEQAKAAAEDAMDEDNNMATGSLALGGEPEDNPRSASRPSAISRPTQPTPTTSLPLDQLANTGMNRSLTPQQQRQAAISNSGSLPQQSRSSQLPAPSASLDMAEFDQRPPQYSQAQYDQMSGHARHGSRFFNNESKSSRNFNNQQPTYFSSGVQGPPPGLPTAGTPPVSGGGMFAHGQGFTSGFGTVKDVNASNTRDRSGTNVGHDKRSVVEHHTDPSILSSRLYQGTSGQASFTGVQGGYNQSSMSYNGNNYNGRW